MNEEISKKLVENAVKKAPKDDLLIYLVVVNRHTGKAEITEFENRSAVGKSNNLPFQALKEL